MGRLRLQSSTLVLDLHLTSLAQRFPASSLLARAGAGCGSERETLSLININFVFI